MKILMICEFFGTEVEFQENQLVRCYRNLGHEVKVLTSTFTSVFDYYDDKIRPSEVRSSFDYRGAQIVRLPYRYNLMNKVRAYRGVGAELESFRPDLVYLHDITPNAREVVRYVRRNRPDCRMIMDIHMDYSNSGKSFLALRVLHGLIRRHFLNVVRPDLDRIYPVVPAGFDFMREIYGVDNAEMELLPLGADLDEIERARRSTDRQALRAELGVGENDLLVFSGGKLTSRKRQELLLEAIDHPDFRRFRVVVAGSVPPKNEAYGELLKRHAAPLGERVRYVGWQAPQDVYRYMQASDLAVFPSSQSIMWQQSIGSGLPLVVGDSGGQDPSYMNANDNIVILRGDDISVAGLRGVLRKLADDPTLRQRMSEGALRTAREVLDWKVLAARTLVARRAFY